MLKVFTMLFAFMLMLPIAFSSNASASGAYWEQQDQTGRVFNAPQRRRRRARRDVGRHPGIGNAFSKAGKSAGRGGKGLGKNMARGRPVRGGKQFGKGMGGFGKHFGKGMGRVGKRIAKP